VVGVEVWIELGTAFGAAARRSEQQRRTLNPTESPPGSPATSG
jgi:hypothetical protein